VGVVPFAQEFYVVPGGATFNRVKKVASGRVYVLQHDGAENVTFFWMQNRYVSRDEEYVRAVRRAIGQPEDLNEFGGVEGVEESDVPAEDSRTMEDDEEGDEDDEDDEDEDEDDGAFIQFGSNEELDPDVAEALFGGGALGDGFLIEEEEEGEEYYEEEEDEDEDDDEDEEDEEDGDEFGLQEQVAGQGDSFRRIRPAIPEDLQQFFQMLGQSQSAQKAGTSLSPTMQTSSIISQVMANSFTHMLMLLLLLLLLLPFPAARTRVRLGSVLNGTDLLEIAMRHPESMETLIEHLPPEIQTVEEVFQTLQSPQFQISIRTLDSALMSDFVNVMRGLNLRPAVRGGCKCRSLSCLLHVSFMFLSSGTRVPRTQTITFYAFVLRC
jgi:hypothetical protein